MRKRPFVQILLLLSLFFGSSSCNFRHFPIIGCKKPYKDSSVPIKELLSAPKSINIEGKELKFEVESGCESTDYNGCEHMDSSCYQLSFDGIFSEEYMLERFWLVYSESRKNTNVGVIEIASYKKASISSSSISHSHEGQKKAYRLQDGVNGIYYFPDKVILKIINLNTKKSFFLSENKVIPIIRENIL